MSGLREGYKESYSHQAGCIISLALSMRVVVTGLAPVAYHQPLITYKNAFITGYLILSLRILGDI